MTGPRFAAPMTTSLYLLQKTCSPGLRNQFGLPGDHGPALPDTVLTGSGIAQSARPTR